MIRFRSVNSIHSQWKSKRMLDTYMQRMRNSNLEIRIACSSCRPQKNVSSPAFFFLFFIFSFGLRGWCFNLQKEWKHNSGLWIPDQWYFQQKEFTNGYVISLTYHYPCILWSGETQFVLKVKLATLTKMLTLDTSLLTIPHLRIRLQLNEIYQSVFFRQ